MIKNNYKTSEANSYVDKAGQDIADQELALRVYTSRIIGENPDLVMHGGCLLYTSPSPRDRG